jgi:kynurenine formamidase
MAVPLRCYDPTALDVICDDRVLLTLQYSTQWDSLAHVGQMFDVDGDGRPEDVFYNGWRAGPDIAGPFTYAGTEQRANPIPPGAHRLGVEHMAAACIQGRAVMIDLEAHFGLTGHIVGYDDLMMVLEKDQVTVEPGDMVCLRTGFAEMLLGMNKQPDVGKLFGGTSALDGRDPKLLQWITDSGLVSLIADNYAVEAHPARACADEFCATLPLHAHCLFKLGVNLGEMWQLHELANWLRANGRSRFLLTAPPLRLPGAVGSPANAIGTV